LFLFFLADLHLRVQFPPPKSVWLEPGSYISSAILSSFGNFFFFFFGSGSDYVDSIVVSVWPIRPLRCMKTLSGPLAIGEDPLGGFAAGHFRTSLLCPHLPHARRDFPFLSIIFPSIPDPLPCSTLGLTAGRCGPVGPPELRLASFPPFFCHAYGLPCTLDRVCLFLVF